MKVVSIIETDNGEKTIITDVKYDIETTSENYTEIYNDIIHPETLKKMIQLHTYFDLEKRRWMTVVRDYDRNGNILGIEFYGVHIEKADAIKHHNFSILKFNLQKRFWPKDH